MDIHPRPAAAKVNDLLGACKLPRSDLQASDFEHFFGCGPEGDPRGVVGIELYGTAGLLRSLAVDEAARGRGCGKRLVQEAEAHAAAHGVRHLYLLTTTAEGYFRSLGYVTVERASVPEAVRRSTEFASLCPVSAVAMVKGLDRSRPADAAAS